MLCLHSDRKDARFICVFIPKFCCQTVLLRCGTTRCLFYQQASLRYQQGCTAYFTEKQRDSSVLMPLQQSVCTVGRTSQRLHNRIEQHVSKPIRSSSLSKKRLLPAGRFKSSTWPIPSLLLVIQPLDFIFYQILPVLNINITAGSLFLPKAALLSIYICS